MCSNNEINVIILKHLYAFQTNHCDSIKARRVRGDSSPDGDLPRGPRGDSSPDGDLPRGLRGDSSPDRHLGAFRNSLSFGIKINVVLN